MSVLEKLAEYVKENEVAINFERVVAANKQLSMTVVSSESTSGRVLFSQGLTKALNLQDTAFLAVVPGRNVVVVASQMLPAFQSCGVLMKVSTTSSRSIAYGKAVVQTVADAFALDFSNCTSQTFKSITVENVDGIDVAIVSMEQARSISELLPLENVVVEDYENEFGQQPLENVVVEDENGLMEQECEPIKELTEELERANQTEKAEQLEVLNEAV